MSEEPAIRRLSSRVVYRNRWMTVREDAVQRLDGSQGIYGLVERPDFALVIPAEGDGFHLVEEFRYAIGRRSWNFPQGSAPDGQVCEPEELARRELAEETGLRAGTMTPLGFLHCSHGSSGQGFHTFLATGLVAGPPDRELEEQDMRQRFVSRREFEEMIRSGAITDDSTVAAYTLLLLRERGTAAG